MMIILTRDDLKTTFAQTGILSIGTAHFQPGIWEIICRADKVIFEDNDKSTRVLKDRDGKAE